MPLIAYQNAEGFAQRVQFGEAQDICLGSDPGWSDAPLSPDQEVAPRHAILARSALNRLLVVIDLTGHKTWVNQHPVARLRVLRQGDTLTLGRCDLRIWEVRIERLKPGDPAIGRKCPVSRRTLRAGDEVIACPGCGTAHERDAWFLVERCAAGCGYPNRAVIMDTLPAWVIVERHLDPDSKLVERIENGQGDTCRAGQARDQVPFQRGQNAVICPSCQSPFHLECFLTLPACPVCQYDIDGLLNQTFMGEFAPHP
jgi:hypothetical protein